MLRRTDAAIEELMNTIVPALYEAHDKLAAEVAHDRAEKSKNNLDARFYSGVEEGLRRFRSEVAVTVREALRK